MSETVTTTTPAPTAATTNDSLTAPQFILGAVIMAIVGGTVAAVFAHGDDGNIKLVLGFVFGLGSSVGMFYFGSSKSSQTKDAVIAAQTTPQPGTTTTVTTPAIGTIQ